MELLTSVEAEVQEMVSVSKLAVLMLHAMRKIQANIAVLWVDALLIACAVKQAIRIMEKIIW